MSGHVGIARRQDTMQAHVQIKESVGCAANLGTWQKIVIVKTASTLAFVRIVTGQATLVLSVNMRKHAIIAGNLDTWLVNVEILQYATFAIRRVILQENVNLHDFLSDLWLLNPTAWTFLIILGIMIDWVILLESVWWQQFVRLVVGEDTWR
jgi:hypothetical protein